MTVDWRHLYSRSKIYLHRVTDADIPAHTSTCHTPVQPSFPSHSVQQYAGHVLWEPRASGGATGTSAHLFVGCCSSLPLGGDCRVASSRQWWTHDIHTSAGNSDRNGEQIREVLSRGGHWWQRLPDGRRTDCTSLPERLQGVGRENTGEQNENWTFRWQTSSLTLAIWMHLSTPLPSWHLVRESCCQRNVHEARKQGHGTRCTPPISVEYCTPRNSHWRAYRYSFPVTTVQNYRKRNWSRFELQPEMGCPYSRTTTKV